MSATVTLSPEDITYLLNLLRGSQRPMTTADLVEALRNPPTRS
jgi:hypothetical protein